MPGKGKHWSWQFSVSTEEVIEGKKKIKATCKFCPAGYIGNATEIAFHLINQCKKIGPEARRTIDQLAGIKKNAEEPPSNKVTKRPGSSFSLSPYIANYFDRISEREQTEFDILLTRAFATRNIAANFLDNPFFKELLNKMRPSYKIPSRNYTFSKVLIPAEFQRVKINLEQTTGKADKSEEAVGKFEEYLQPQLMQILNNRREFGRTDVTYLMDLLEPSDRGEYLSQLEVQAAMDLLANKISKNPAFITRENEIMIELAQWRGRTGKFAEGQRKFAWDALKATPPVDGLTFWTGFYSDSVLSIVYKALQIVQITAAPTERNWSHRAAIHTKVRNRLEVEMASKLTFIKHNLMLEHADLFNKSSRRDASVEEKEEELGVEEQEENANEDCEVSDDDILFEDD